MSTETRIPVQQCWKCGYKFDSMTCATSDHKPKEGNVSMCIACGALAIYTKEMQLRKPTDEENAQVSNVPVLVTAQILRASVVGDKLKPKR